MPHFTPAAALTVTALCLAPLFTPRTLPAQTPGAPAQLKIDPATIVHPVSPTLYGMMTEEINHAFDGGLYAELLSNRTFRPIFYGIEHWEIVRNGNAAATLETDRTTGPSTALPTSLKVSVTEASPGSEAGLSNTGYWGVPVKPHTAYHGSFYAKVDDAGVGPSPPASSATRPELSSPRRASASAAPGKSTSTPSPPANSSPPRPTTSSSPSPIPAPSGCSLRRSCRPPTTTHPTAIAST